MSKTQEERQIEQLETLLRAARCGLRMMSQKWVKELVGEIDATISKEPEEHPWDPVTILRRDDLIVLIRTAVINNDPMGFAFPAKLADWLLGDAEQLRRENKEQ